MKSAKQLLKLAVLGKGCFLLYLHARKDDPSTEKGSISNLNVSFLLYMYWTQSFKSITLISKNDTI